MDDTGHIRGNPDGRPALGLPAVGIIDKHHDPPDMGITGTVGRTTTTERTGRTAETRSEATVEEAVKLQQSANLIVDIFTSAIVDSESEETWRSIHS